MKKIYFVRHGSTENNVANTFQDENTALSDLGIKQAQELSNRFKHINIDTLLSSNMNRALQTANEISITKGLSVISSHLFQEVLRPSFVRNKSKNDEEVKIVMQEVKKNFGNIDYKHSDEENFYDLMERTKNAINFINEQEGSDIAVVTHGVYLTFIIGYMMFENNFTPEEFHILEKFLIAKNTGITLVEISNNKFKLISWNDHAHLGELDIN